MVATSEAGCGGGDEAGPEQVGLEATSSEAGCGGGDDSIPMILQKRMEKLLLTPLMKGLKLMWKGVE